MELQVSDLCVQKQKPEQVVYGYMALSLVQGFFSLAAPTVSSCIMVLSLSTLLADWHLQNQSLIVRDRNWHSAQAALVRGALLMWILSAIHSAQQANELGPERPIPVIHYSTGRPANSSLMNSVLYVEWVLSPWDHVQAVVSYFAKVFYFEAIFARDPLLFILQSAVIKYIEYWWVRTVIVTDIVSIFSAGIPVQMEVPRRQQRSWFSVSVCRGFWMVRKLMV